MMNHMRHSRGLKIALVSSLVLLSACDSASAPKAVGASTSTVASTQPPPTTSAPVPPPPDNVYSATAAGNMAPATAGVPTRAYVPNSDGASVDVIDPATLKVV